MLSPFSAFFSVRPCRFALIMHLLTILFYSEYREAWVSAKYVHRLFGELRKGFLMVTLRNESAMKTGGSTKPQLSFVVLKSKLAAFHNAEYGSQQADTLITEMDGSAISLTPIVFADAKKKKGACSCLWALCLSLTHRCVSLYRLFRNQNMALLTQGGTARR